MRIIIRTSPAFDPKGRHYTVARRQLMLKFCVNNEENQMLKTKHLAELRSKNVFTSIFRTNLSSTYGFKVMSTPECKYVAYGVSLQTGEASGDLFYFTSLIPLRCTSGRIVTEALLAARKA